jgi:hypothetical protein
LWDEPPVRAALDALWPFLSPQRLVAGLLASEGAHRRGDHGRGRRRAGLVAPGEQLPAKGGSLLGAEMSALASFTPTG